MWKSTLPTQSSVHLGYGGEDDDDEDDFSEGVYTMEEVAKHNKKGGAWVFLNGRVLNVSNFWSLHPDFR